MTHPPEPSPGDFVRWAPIGKVQEDAQASWGRDGWRVVIVRRCVDPKLASSSVMLIPVVDGAPRHDVVQWVRLDQIIGVIGHGGKR